jgi:hypothetical protein
VSESAVQSAVEAFLLFAWFLLEQCCSNLQDPIVEGIGTKLLHGHSFQKVVVLIEALTLYFYILAFWRHKTPNTSAWQIILFS